MQMGKYIVVLVIGIAFGWLCEVWLGDSAKQRHSMEAIPKPMENDTQVIDAVSIVDLREAVEDADLEKGPGAVNEVTPLMIIQNISLMDEKTFNQYLSNLEKENSPYSQELTFGLLAALPTITDATSRYRLIDLLGTHRFLQMTKETNLVEGWLMNKIRTGDQSGFWLEVISDWGIEKPENFEYLVKNLPSLHDSDARVSTLIALSRSAQHNLRYLDNPATIQNRELVNMMVEPFLLSQEELERAGAVRALGAFPGTGFTEKILNALEDPSEKVRISAMMALSGLKRPNNKTIKDILVNRMQTKEASDIERLTAWQMVSLYPIEQEHYEAIYEFGNFEQQELSERIRRQFRRGQNRLGY